MSDPLKVLEPSELFQGIIRNIETKKERTLLMGERHKLEGNLICKAWGREGGVSDHSSYDDTNSSSAGLKHPTSLLGSLSPSSQT